MKVYSFPRGGFPYEDPTAPQKSQAVTAFLPSLSVIPLGNNIKKVYPVVAIGDVVREGMLIGRASGTGTVNVHATVPGKILRKASWKDNDGIEYEGFIIKLDGAFEKLGKKEEIFPWNGVNSYDLQRIISDQGIVEMDKAEKPLADMISESRKKDKLTLVVRLVFDDPWLVADHALCQERMEAVIEGAAIVARACSKVSQIIFAVSHREKELGRKLCLAAEKIDIPSALVLTSSRYPQRNSRELEIALRIYEKKEALSLGSFLILGPAVLAAAFDAVVYKKPILDRYVAVGGSAVKSPQIMKVRIGTRIRDIIEQCGGLINKAERIVTGSPISGKEVAHLDEPIRKNCYAIAAMTKSQAALHKMQNCINCGECRAVCPVGLDPQNIYKRVRMQEIESALPLGCHGCGCCKVVCPSALPLLETILEKNQEDDGV